MDEPDPSAYQPKLTRWGHTWRLVLMLTTSALAWSRAIVGQWRDQPELLVVDVVVGVLSYVLVFNRRSRPLTVAVLVAVLSAASGLAAGPALLAAVSLATRRVYWQIILVGMVIAIAGQMYPTTQPTGSPDPAFVTFTATAALIAAILVWGMYVGSRRELLWILRRRADEAEFDQETRMAQARAAERTRIAREMHDVLAHRISHISLQAGVLAFRNDLTDEAARAGVELIQQGAHEALTDLRGVLGVLRDASGAPLNAPQPTVDDLADLVETARGSGQRVTYDVSLDDRAHVPDAVGRTIYRVIQEGLTNVGKHAPGSLLDISVSGSPQEGIELVLTNPSGITGVGIPGAGLGLVGLRERLDLRGGRLDTQSKNQTFRLTAWLPWAP